MLSNLVTEQPPPIIIKCDRAGHITRRFIQEHRELTFIYGADFAGIGCEGMQWEMAKECNSYPVYTVYKLCPSNRSYFMDSNFDVYQKMIDASIDLVPLHQPVIVPPKIGMGASRLKELAPRLYAHLRRRIDSIIYLNIVWDIARL